MEGNYTSDYNKANEWLASALGLPVGTKFHGQNGYFAQPGKDEIRYTWHHHQDGKSMMLIPIDIHSNQATGTSHAGGSAIARQGPEYKNKLPNPKTTSLLWTQACQ
jgi:hypothetical protein